MTVKTVIFLGAGASSSEGAPLQGTLFREYFGSVRGRTYRDEMDNQLATFFSRLFAIDVDQDDLDTVQFPTFEEVLGLTDLAILRKEAFKEFEIENRANNSGRLRFVSQALVFLLAKVLEEKLRHPAILHRRLIEKLDRAQVLRRTAFISTNYDILIDNALTERHEHGVDLDYGIRFSNFDQFDEWHEPRRGRAVFLMKPHGSLNWLFCPVCNEMTLTPKEKGVVTRLISDVHGATCPACESVYMPLIVPPTFYKDLSNTFLSAIWNRTEHILRGAEHIIFCGYSFPDADMHIKYLVKRAQTNRSVRNLRVTVVNNHADKTIEATETEKFRFLRFLGRDVNYTNLTFEDFATDPIRIMQAD